MCCRVRPGACPCPTGLSPGAPRLGEARTGHPPLRDILVCPVKDTEPARVDLTLGNIGPCVHLEHHSSFGLPRIVLSPRDTWPPAGSREPSREEGERKGEGGSTLSARRVPGTFADAPFTSPSRQDGGCSHLQRGARGLTWPRPRSQGMAGRD